MNRSILIGLLLILPISALAQSEKAVLRYAKTTEASKLDSGLPSEPLDRWLRSGPARIDKLTWSISPDCELKEPLKGTPQDEQPFCVRFGFSRGNVGGWGVMKTGTSKEHISGSPRIESLILPSVAKRGSARLSVHLAELPRLLDEVEKQGAQQTRE